jgi:hypothetical protein
MIIHARVKSYLTKAEVWIKVIIETLKYNFLQPVVSESYLPLSCGIFAPSPLTYAE